MDIKKFKKKVAFTKAIEITKAEGVYKGYLEFMTCDDTRCLPPNEVPFKVDFANMKAMIGDDAMDTAGTTPVTTGAPTAGNNPAGYAFVKDYGKAIECFSKAAQIAPNNVNINLNHVQALLKQAKISDQEKTTLQSAESTLTKITRLSPEDPRFSRYSELSRLTQLMLQKL